MVPRRVPIRGLTHVADFDAGLRFAEELLRAERRLPVVVISLLPNGSPPLAHLPEALASDLAGIANVVTVDVDASWAVTDVLGPKLSCFDGGVRVYWPNLEIGGEYRRHPLWTRAKLVQSTRDHREAADRIANATTPGDFEALANDYAYENDVLRDQVAELEQKLRESETRELSLEEKVNDLEQCVRDLKGSSGASASGSDAFDPLDDSPKPGEVRFYKKRFSTPGHDVLVQVKDCGHENWESAHKAEKARKGIIRHEGGRDDWKKLEHCASCTGGGVWRVVW